MRVSLATVRLWSCGVVLAVLCMSARGAQPELPTLEQVIAAFEAADKACNDGKGRSESPDSASLGWGESSWLRCYWELYELTSQTRWWDKIIEHFDRMLATMTDHDGDGFKSWQTTKYSIALIRAEPMHNRGTAAIAVKQAKLFNGKQARQVAGHRYLIEFIDAKTYAVRDATTAQVLVAKAVYASGQPITVAPHVVVTVTGKPEQGDRFCIWTTAPRPVEYVVHQGMVLTSVARFIEVAIKRPAGDRYRAKAEAYLAAIEKHFLQGNEKSWIDTGDGAGAYRFTPEPTERYPNRILPHNQYLALARTWLVLADVAKNPLFRQRAVAMAKNFKRALRLVDGAYEWYYWDWIENGQPGHSGVEDTSHGHIDVGFAVEAVRRGVVFTDEDGRRLARTLLVRMWDGSTTQPRFGGRVDTKEGDKLPVADWIELGQWDPKAFDLIATATAAQFKPDRSSTRMATVLVAKQRIERAKRKPPN